MGVYVDGGGPADRPLVVANLREPGRMAVPRFMVTARA